MMICYADTSQLIYRTEPTTKKWKTKKVKNGHAQKYRETVRGESVELVLTKKRKATVGRICRKKGFKPGMKE